MRGCKNRQHFTKKVQKITIQPLKKALQTLKKAPVSSIQVKKSTTDLQK